MFVRRLEVTLILIQRTEEEISKTNSIDQVDLFFSLQRSFDQSSRKIESLMNVEKCSTQDAKKFFLTSSREMNRNELKCRT